MNPYSLDAPRRQALQARALVILRSPRAKPEVHGWPVDATGRPGLAEGSQLLGLDRDRREAYAWRGASISLTGEIRLSDPMRGGAFVDESGVIDAVQHAWTSRPRRTR